MVFYIFSLSAGKERIFFFCGRTEKCELLLERESEREKEGGEAEGARGRRWTNT